jgi:hypothetical protein
MNSLSEKDWPVEQRGRMFGSPAKLRLGLLSVSVMLPLFAAEGQDALRSAISLDAVIAAQTSQTVLQPERPHLGPVQLTLGAYAGTSYDDNINGSANNPQSDVLSRAGANLRFDWPATDHSDLQFGTGIGYVNYLRNTRNSGLEISPDSALTYALSLDDVILTLYDQFSYTRQVTTEAALANVATRPQLNNTAGLRVEWNPGQWTLQTGYSHNDNWSDHANDYLNRSSEYFFGRAGWRFAEATQAGVEASGGLTAYQLASQGNSYNVSVGGYVEWQLRPALHFTLRGGPTLYEFSSPGPTGGNSTLNSYYISFEASHQLTDFLSHNLRIERDVQLGANQGSDYVEQLTAGYSLSWALTQRISVGASVTYEDGQQPLGNFPFHSIEDYQRYGGGLQATWQFTGHLAGSLSYNHWLRDSNLPDRGYSENSVSFNLNYTF